MRNFKEILFCLLVLAFSVAFVLPNRPQRPTELGERIVEAISSRDFKQLDALQPGVAEWKVFGPDQTEGLTDEEIEAKMDAGNTNKLRRGFDEIMAAGRFKKIKFRNIRFNEVIIKRYYEEKDAPIGLEVMFFYDHYNGKILVSAIEQAGEWYLLEMKGGENAFQDIPVQSRGGLGNFQFRP